MLGTKIVLNEEKKNFLLCKMSVATRRGISKGSEATK